MAAYYSTRRFFAKALKTDHRTFAKVMGEPKSFLIVGPAKKIVPIYKVEEHGLELEDKDQK